jgi:hypothetical protein
MAIEVLSVHFPKSGGTSLRESLKAAYGESGIRYDYADDPANPCSPYNLDPDGCKAEAQASVLPDEIKVIHGHFPISKYDHLQGVRRITFLRHPVETMISIYFYWKTLDEGHGLFQYCRERNLDVLGLARIPLLRYLLSRTYFGGVDMGIFDFVGVTEFYQLSLRRLSDLLEVPVVETRQNLNRFPGYDAKVQELKQDAAVMNGLRTLLSEDIRFYEKMVERIVR